MKNDGKLMDNDPVKQHLISTLCYDLKKIMLSSSISEVEPILGKEFCKHIFVNAYGCWIWQIEW